MCDTCGCGDIESGYTIKDPSSDEKQILNPQEISDHNHNHGHGHGHNHSHEQHSEKIELNSEILLRNNLMAERNRGYFEAKGIKAINLVSSPGSGKTTLIEKLIPALKSTRVYVIEGDQQSMNDANRIAQTGAHAVQINTGNGCHLDASMIHEAIKALNPTNESLLLIENVGNLVCPAMFDLGETSRIIISSVTEGDDKPTKYPNMFESSHLCIVNKTDLLPYVDFSMERFKQDALQVNHHLDFIEVSATKETNLDEIIHWIES